MKKVSKKEQERLAYAKWLASLERLHPRFARQPHEAPSKQLSYKLTTPAGRNTRKLPSLVTPGGTAAKVASPQYSGTKMLGVGTMHKSNMVPIFNSEEATAIASMRR